MFVLKSDKTWYFCFGISFLFSILYFSDVLANCSKKNVSYKDFILKNTKLLSYLPWPSRRQSTIFITSNSNLDFLTFSILSAKTEPLFSVVFVFWKELNNYFLIFFLKSLFFAMLGILSTPLFLWLKSTALCTLSNFCPLFAITFPLNRDWNSVYRQSTCG